MTLLPGEMCAKESCGFPYVHPPHPYSTWSMYRLIEMLKNALHCVDDEQLLEVLAVKEMDNLHVADAAPKNEDPRSEPVDPIHKQTAEFLAGHDIRAGALLTIDRATGMVVPLDRPTYPGRYA